MDPLADVTRTIALTMGMAWASGINLYAAVLVLGLLGAGGHAALPPGLETLSHPLVIAAAGFMYAVEFFADKIPGVDSAWDLLHTFVRIPAGALLAASAVADVDPALAVAAGLVGGALSAGSHAAKAGTRLLVNASPEPFSNVAASVAEDIAVAGGVWLAVSHPLLFLALLATFVLALLVALPRLYRILRGLLARAAAWMSGRPMKPLPAGSLQDEDRRPTV